MQKKLIRYLEINKKYVIDLVSRLIEIPTVNPPGKNYEKITDLLEAELRKIGLTAKRYVTPKQVLNKFGIKNGSDRINLVGRWNAGGERTLHINSHYDVVPATDKWDTDPFKAVIKNNKIYGRGSEDMKGNIASVLFALKALKKCGIRPAINLEISFTPDEETGGRTGLGYLVRKGLVKADYAMSEGCSEDYVSMGNKGVLWVEVTVEGKSAHASIPHKGVNSFERMFILVRELEKIKKMISGKRTKYSMRDDISKSPSFVMGGLLEGGLKVNVVPGVVKFGIDRRLIPEEDADAARRQIEEVVEKFNNTYKDSKVSAKFVSQENPAISKNDDRFFNVVSNAVESVIAKKAKFSIMPGATDMRYFMWKNVPSLGYSARGGETWHSDNEFVYITSLVNTAKVYGLIMMNL